MNNSIKHDAALLCEYSIEVISGAADVVNVLILLLHQMTSSTSTSMLK